MPSRRLGPYEVVARVASGGAGHIFVARQEGSEGFARVVCLKTLMPERAVDPHYVSAFFEEARLAARLNHPNCIQIYDLGQINKVLYISMEFVIGETLAAIMSNAMRHRQPLSPQVAAAVTAAICDGLQHAHQLSDASGQPLQIVHRDVSPPNVMVTFEGIPKVLDFGIAKAITGEDTRTGIVKGKACYMSPEQITGRRVDHRSDIYAAGVILFECLTNERLYPETSPHDIARRMYKSKTPRVRELNPELPKELDEITARALAVDRAKRFSSAQEMSDALNAYLAQAGAAAGRTVLAAHLSDQYGPRGRTRRTLIDALREGVYDEAVILEGLNGRPVLALDLYGDDSPLTVHEYRNPKVLRAENLGTTRVSVPIPPPPIQLVSEEITAPGAWPRASDSGIEVTHLESHIEDPADTFELDAHARSSGMRFVIAPSRPVAAAALREETGRLRRPLKAPLLSPGRTLAALAIGLGVGVGIGVILTFWASR